MSRNKIGVNILQVKIHHGNETKKFKMNSSSYEDLLQATRKLSWTQPIPDRFKFYYNAAEVLCSIDDQNSLNKAIESSIKQNKYTLLKLIVA